MRWRFSGSAWSEDEDGRARARMSEAERGVLAPSCQIASAALSRTIALSDMGTLIMLASSAASHFSHGRCV